MRTLIAIAALAAFTAPALAGVLPIKGTYCGSGTSDDYVLDTDGVGGFEDGCTFKAVISAGPNWWIVSQECTNPAEPPTTRIEVKGKKAFITDSGKPATTLILHRCPKALPAAE